MFQTHAVTAAAASAAARQNRNGDKHSRSVSLFAAAPTSDLQSIKTISKSRQENGRTVSANKREFAGDEIVRNEFVTSEFITDIADGNNFVFFFAADKCSSAVKEADILISEFDFKTIAGNKAKKSLILPGY